MSTETVDIITNIDQLVVNREYDLFDQQWDEVSKVRCMGNPTESPDNKVYFVTLPSKETPASIKRKFERDIMPNCFTCWHWEVGDRFILSEAN